MTPVTNGARGARGAARAARAATPGPGGLELSPGRLAVGGLSDSFARSGVARAPSPTVR
eukprot:CAMPEP_0206054520 /NCGR_PEP_ID=MMETSP1466-20131121/38233_1 /ASSEMBLY_ACC=CAM_ASM_001126 /TAXON_ID=44452 /ORGANISM="Pavlova gyrans, Strain CCMP608" /LENGTH=58 /DNA_ID=CAMNT_0053429725 /DNA_START=167 /DNA_END=339 /DNA_ORIENTATION=+